MTINKEKLISLLVEKTEQDREQVEEQLSELISRIQKAAGEGKSFEIEDFGTFTMQEDMLHFEPNDKLETEINNRYAGMKPIELIGAFKEPDGGEIPDVSDGTDEDNEVWGIEKEADSEPEKPERDDEVYETPGIEEDVEEEPTPQVIIERAEKLAEKQTLAEESKPRQAAQSEEVLTSGADDRKEKKDKEQDPIGRFLVAAVVVLSIGIAGWFTYDLGLFGGNDSTPANETSSSPPVAQQQETNPDRSNDAADDEPPQSEESASGSQEEELIPEDEVTTNADESRAQEESGDGSPYGLYGTADSNITGGYTIVVHSLRRQQQAAAMRERLNEEGYRTILSEASINGETYFRVGIGQFESVASAQEAVAELSDNYKDNHFIRRI